MTSKLGRIAHAICRYILTAMALGVVTILLNVGYELRYGEELRKMDNPLELPAGQFKEGDIVTDVDNTWRGIVLREEYSPYRWYIVNRIGYGDEQPLKIRGSELRHPKAHNNTGNSTK